MRLAFTAEGNDAMKLAVGMRVIDTRNAQLARHQVTAFTETTVHVRRIEYNAEHGLWQPPAAEINKPAVGWLRRDFDTCFVPDPDDPRSR